MTHLLDIIVGAIVGAAAMAWWFAFKLNRAYDKGHFTSRGERSR